MSEILSGEGPDGLLPKVEETDRIWASLFSPKSPSGNDSMVRSECVKVQGHQAVV